MKTRHIILFVFLLLIIPLSYAGLFGPESPPPTPGPTGAIGPQGPPGGNYTAGIGIIIDIANLSINISYLDTLYYSILNPNGYINQSVGDTLYYPLSTNPNNYLNSTTASGVWVEVTGDTMTGALNMSNNDITDVNILYVHNISGRSPINILSEMISNNSITANTFYGNIQGVNGTIFGMTITNGTISNMHVSDSAIFNTSLVPELNDTWSLGNETNKWKDFYVENIVVTNITSPNLNFVKIPGDTMTGNLNMSDNNITDVNTIRASYYGSRSPITFVDEFGQPIAQISTNSSPGNGTWGYIRAYEIVVDRLRILGLLNYSTTEPPDYYFSDDIWIYKVGNNGTFTFYFNESKLNQTIFDSQVNITQQQIKDLGFNITTELTNLYYPLDTNPKNYINDTTIITLNYSQINNTPDLSIYNDTLLIQDINLTIKQPQGPYIINNSQYFWMNESLLNITINNISKVSAYEETLNITVSSGTGTVISITTYDFMITQIIVTPTTVTNNYKFGLYEYPSGNVIDKDRATHIGVWNIEKNYVLNSQIQANITNANIDELFIITIKYIKNGIII